MFVYELYPGVSTLLGATTSCKSTMSRSCVRIKSLSIPIRVAFRIPFMFTLAIFIACVSLVKVRVGGAIYVFPLRGARRGKLRKLSGGVQPTIVHIHFLTPFWECFLVIF